MKRGHTLHTFNRFTAFYKTVIPELLEARRLGVFRFLVNPDTGFHQWHVNFGAEVRARCWPDLVRPIWNLATRVLDGSRDPAYANSLAQECSLMADFYAQGTHVMRVGEDVVEAMKQMDLPIGPEHYHQPFPCLGIEMPNTFSIIRWEPEYRRVGVILHNLESLDGEIFHVIVPDGFTMEQAVAGVYQRPDCVAAPNRSEHLRIVMNLCLFATHFGMRDDNECSDLERRSKASAKLDRAERRGEDKIAELNRIELTTIPNRHAIVRSGPLFRTSRGGHGNGEPSGKTVAPHWRRGHWRVQRYGKGLTESKTIPIQPVFINADLLLGDITDTGTIYE